MSARIETQILRLIGTAAMLAFLLLGGWWALDRGRRWETPSLEAAFSKLRTSEASAAAGWWLMPVNLRCPHCVEALERLRAEQVGLHRPLLVALIVDHDGMPSGRAVRDLPADQVWWDGAGVWRHRWGHRIYGEVLRFDSRGRYLETLPARPAAAGVPAPPDR
jgi:hypothetical protein